MNKLIKMYNTNMTTNITTEVNEYKRGNWINMINPTESEIFEVCRNLNIEQEFIKYSLDYEEKARIDLEEDDGTILFIIDVPIIERENDVEIYTTMPVGVIFVRDEYVITVSLKENDIIKKMERIVGKKVITYKKSQFLFQLFYENSSAFLNLLKEINKKTEHIERTLKKDLKNEDLLKMLNLEKALVYITTSLKSDEVVMEKTLRGKIIKLYNEIFNINNNNTCNTNISCKFMGNECSCTISKLSIWISSVISSIICCYFNCNDMVEKKKYVKLIK